jgi:uncharacterized protein
VRLSLLGFTNSLAKTVLDRPENEYPLARQQLRKYYLSTVSCILCPDPPNEENAATYEAHSLEDTLVRTLAP